MHIILISNYRSDEQYSMLQFSRIVYTGLVKRGIHVTEVYPREIMGKWIRKSSRWFKWFAYVDKYVIFPRTLKTLRKKLEGGIEPIVFHICDHSNSIYQKSLGNFATIITCHDLIAIRSARGEFEEQNLSISGFLLQKWIQRNISKVNKVICDSEATEKDLNRILPKTIGLSGTSHLSFKNPMKRLNRTVAAKKLPEAFHPQNGKKHILHVGNNAWYKNRWFVLKTFLELETKNPNLYHLSLAGAELDSSQIQWIQENNLTGKITNPTHLDAKQLEALYSLSDVFVFPSLCEGFGWPPLEAQCCEVPVISTENGSLKEVLNKSAFVPSDFTPIAWATSIYSCLANPEVKNRLIGKGKENILRFSEEKLLEDYVRTYKSLIE